MATFPLTILPKVSWHDVSGSRDTYFGAGRNGPYPTHGACDLIAPAGSPVLSIEDGEIIRFYWFYDDKNDKGCVQHTWALDVKHLTFVGRYGEISPTLPDAIREKIKKKDMSVSEGETIATVGRQCGDAMLHFEMFKDLDRGGYLTDKSHATKYIHVPQANYERRSDLLDPTPYLDAWVYDLKVKLNRTMDLSI